MANLIAKKLKTADIFTCDNIDNFLNVVVQLMQYSGVSPTRFYLCEFENIRFLTKICFYVKSSYELGGVITSKYLPGFDAELGILEEFKKTIIYENVSPHIVELAYSRICKMTTVAPSAEECKLITSTVHFASGVEEDLKEVLCKYRGMASRGLAHDKCLFLVLEHLSMTLDTLMRKSYSSAVYTAIIKSILFQIIYTLYAIQLRYPKFRHYDLHSDNVMVLVDAEYKFGDPKYVIYKVHDTEYAIPYFGIVAKIIDFEGSVLPEKKLISMNTANRIQMNERADNDILLLLYWVYQISVLENKSTEIEALLTALEPNKTFVRYNTEYIASVEIPTYREMLQNKVFKDYINDNIPLHLRYKTYSC